MSAFGWRTGTDIHRDLSYRLRVLGRVVYAKTVCCMNWVALNQYQRP